MLSEALFNDDENFFFCALFCSDLYFLESGRGTGGGVDGGSGLRCGCFMLVEPLRIIVIIFDGEIALGRYSSRRGLRSIGVINRCP